MALRVQEKGVLNDDRKRDLSDCVPYKFLTVDGY